MPFCSTKDCVRKGVHQEEFEGITFFWCNECYNDLEQDETEPQRKVKLKKKVGKHEMQKMQKGY
jgi:hypothetical protein